MKIILLSDASSAHTVKWVNAIKKKNFEIVLFSFFMPSKLLIKEYNELNVKIISPDLKSKIKNLREPNLSKIKYLNSILLLRKLIKNFRPDIIHAHYASSYGFLAYLSRFKPFILSVWGSDIYYFPYYRRINKWIISLVIGAADKVCSTSYAMKKIIEKEYKRMDIEIIPFGVSIKHFKFFPKSKQNFIVGTIKSIENHNGIDCLIEAARIIVYEYRKNIKFLIAGEGSLKELMQKKAASLMLQEHINFAGHIPHQNVIKYYNSLSIFIAVSRRESFGVSVVEAGACGIPSITSNIGGLTEVNLNNRTGLVISPNKPRELAESILKLYANDELRKKLGKGARNHVINNFNWSDNVDQMIKIYNIWE